VSGTNGHDVLIIEDDREFAAFLANVVHAAGHRAHVAYDVESGLALMRKVNPCLVLADHELPIRKDAEAFAASGVHLIKETRAFDGRVVPGTQFHVLAMIVITQVADNGEFGMDMAHLGADRFQAKPIGKGQEATLLRKMDFCFEQSKRASHDDCAKWARALADEDVPPPVVEGPHLRIDGTRAGRRSVIFIDSKRRTIQDAPLKALLKGIVVRELSPETFSAKEALYMGRSKNAIRNIQRAFDGLIAGDFRIFEADGSRNYRLNPAVVVDEVRWPALAEHSDPTIRRIAKEQVDRRERKATKG
jgi:CheY-like chemotaxis protein